MVCMVHEVNQTAYGGTNPGGYTVPQEVPEVFTTTL